MKYKQISKELLEKIYLNNPEATIRSAAKEMGITHNTIDKALIFHGILPKEKIRGLRPRESLNPFIRDKEWLKKRYLMDERSIKQIAEEIGSTAGAIHSALTWAKIPIRGVMEGFSKRFPDGRTGKLATNWKGGRIVTSRYVWIYKPEHPYARKSGYVQEHRIIVEQNIGRILEPQEMVHHLNGNPQDNRIENLQVASKKEHSRSHFDDCKKMAELIEEIDRLKKLLDENKIAY